MDDQKPKLVLVKGMSGIFCPKMLATNVGGMKITETMVKILMILFCSTLTKPMNISCMLFSRSKLNLAWSIRELMSRSMMVNFGWSSAGIISLRSKLDMERCFSMMFWRICMICSCSSVISINTPSSASRSVSLNTVILSMMSSIKSASLSTRASSRGILSGNSGDWRKASWSYRGRKVVLRYGQ